MIDTLTNSIILAAGATGAAEGGSLGGLLLYIGVALGFSFLCSVLEAVLLSSSISHVELLAQQGRRAGLMMQRHKVNVERPISAILTLNTIAHTVGAAGAGAQAAAVFGNQYIGIISAVLTLLILVFSEIIPKTIGAVYWKALMPFSAYTIRLLVWVFFPAVWVFEVMTSLLRPHEEAPSVTRSELEVLAKISVEEGALLERENRIVRNLLHLHSVSIQTIMTPRTVVLAFAATMTVREVMRKYPRIAFTRLPIYDKSIDHVTGYVLRHDIYEKMADDEYDVTLEQISQQLHAVPETNNVAQVMEEFITRREQIFLVIDEFGGTSGIVTLEDAIESLLGIEITDETDVVADLRDLAQQRYQRQLAEQSAAERLGTGPDLTQADEEPPTAPTGTGATKAAAPPSTDSPAEPRPPRPVTSS